MLNFPITKSKEDIKLRRALFNKFDYNGNNLLSITEISNGWKHFKNLPEIDVESVAHRAFMKSKAVYQAKKKRSFDDDMVCRKEFRYTLRYIAEMYQF